MVAAGGRGDRAASDGLKQFRAVAGRALLEWAVDPLAAAGCAPIVVVLPADVLDEGRAIVTRPGVVFAAGGPTRQASVARGLEHVTSERVVVHDAARPFATAALVARVLGALDHSDAAIAAVPVEDTLKFVDDARVVTTIARAGLWRAQTPQAFRTQVLLSAHSRAAAGGVIATDDAELVELAGGSVTIVDGLTTNIKVTYAEDFALAEAIANGRR